MAEIMSPLVNGARVVLEKQLSALELARQYQEKFQLDIGYLFKETTVINLFRCTETGYRFYYPFHVSGDDVFYRHFGMYDWYYLSWKWEHEESLKYILPEDHVLEVGAANGNFLDGLKQRGIHRAVGLELNYNAAEEGGKRGLTIYTESVTDHAVTHSNQYDVVCSFQVLEHIPQVKEVIEAMVSCLKPGGKLIISVPNNDGYIKDNPLPSKILNMPPHHMGLWNEESLRNLSKVFPLEYVKACIEPLQPIHMDTYQYTRVKGLLLNSEFLTKIYWKLRIHLLVRQLLKLFSRYIKGHSIMSIYTKRSI